MDQGLGNMVGQVLNYVGSDADSNWTDVDGKSWPTIYQLVAGGPYHATVLVAMNETRQGVNFYALLATLRDFLMADLKTWAQSHSHLFDDKLLLAMEWSLRPCAGAVFDLSTEKIGDKFQPEI